MPYELTIQPHDQYLKFIVTGTIESDELQGFAQTLWDKSEEYRQTKGLLDERDLTNNLDTMDLYTLSETDLVAMAVTGGVRMACLCHEEDTPEHHMFETLFRNRSLNYRLFTNEQDALDWLLS